MVIDMHKWRCPDSETWDRFVLDDNMPDREALRKHLTACKTCEFIVNQRLKEYAELEKAWVELSDANVIILRPAAWDEDFHYRNGSLLAAQGREESERTASITLSTEDNTVFLKAVQDAHTHNFWLYLLADNAEKYKGALVKPFGMDKEFMVDAGGRVNIGRVSWPFPNPDTAEIRLPDSVFTLDPLNIKPEIGKTIELETSRGDRIEVSIVEADRVSHIELQILAAQGRGPKSYFKVALKPSENIELCHIKPVVGNKVSFDTPSGMSRLDIYLYQSTEI